MAVIRFILRLLGWLVTIILQIACSFLVIFLFSIGFSGISTITRSGWLLLLFGIWLGYVVGINLVGLVALNWIWKGFKLLALPRLLSTMVGALLPLLILVGIGYSVPIGDTGTRFYDIVTNNWQPILTQASLFIAVVAFYFPGILKLGENT